MSDCEHDQQLAELEQAIFDARNYVVPSDDLRPRVVEEAKQRSWVEKIAFRTSLLAMSCIIVWSLYLPAIRFLGEFRDSVTAPSSREVEQIALDLSAQSRRESSWSTVDAFEQIRALRIDAPTKVDSSKLNAFGVATDR